VAVIDLDQKQLLDGQGQPLAGLAEVSVERAFQLGSSSKALVIRYGSKKVVVARGSPFAGDVEPLEAVLRRHGLC